MKTASDLGREPALFRSGTQLCPRCVHDRQQRKVKLGGDFHGPEGFAIAAGAERCPRGTARAILPDHDAGPAGNTAERRDAAGVVCSTTAVATKGGDLGGARREK